MLPEPTLHDKPNDFIFYNLAMKSFLSLSDFDQLPHNVPVTATIADIEEKKGFIDYYVSKIKDETRHTGTTMVNVVSFPPVEVCDRGEDQRGE